MPQSKSQNRKNFFLTSPKGALRRCFSTAGFSIVEMLVVIAIIGFLGSLIFSQLQSSRARARDAEREQEIKSLQNALALYVVDAGRYPPAGSYPYGPSALTGTDPVSQALTGAGALSSVPADPINSGNFVYTYSSADGFEYTITYWLETDSISGKSSGEQTATP